MFQWFIKIQYFPSSICPKTSTMAPIEQSSVIPKCVLMWYSLKVFKILRSVYSYPTMPTSLTLSLLYLNVLWRSHLIDSCLLSVPPKSFQQSNCQISKKVMCFTFLFSTFVPVAALSPSMFLYIELHSDKPNFLKTFSKFPSWDYLESIIAYLNWLL